MGSLRRSNAARVSNRELSRSLLYGELQSATDGAGNYLAFLATEANYRWLKDLQTRNMIVPVVGDFAGPNAIRAVGQYLRDHNATVR